MNTLIVRHVGSGDAAEFRVERQDGKISQKNVPVVSPVGFAVEGRPDSDLMRELRWYLETFLDYPFPPETDHADRVLAALKGWGEQAFAALFGDNVAGGWFNEAVAKGHDRLVLQVSSDDPRILGWPWEALRDPQLGVLAQTCQVERRLNSVRDAYPISDQLPADRVNILLVTARPYEGDVHYRSISRPLVELIEEQKLPAQVTVLRPPTFARLREHLRERPNYYHIVHFDGHGSYRPEGAGPVSGHVLRGPMGRLVFEDEDGQADPKTAEQLSVLLRDHRIPAVVLNACQSGMVDGDAADPFASVAAALVRSGVRSVVAMAYSLYVSGAQQFLPAFYRRLFETGSIAQATREGRQQMLAERGRVCVRGEFDLEDWLVPVVYQQDPPDFSFATRGARGQREAAESEAKRGEAPPAALPLPEEIEDRENPYGFIGRDGAVLELERAMRREPAGILIHGLGGVGKTTLARGFVQWLNATDGLGNGCFWFTFQDIRGAEYVINRIGESLFGPQFIPAPMDQKIDALAAALRDHRFVIVWDNFEVVRGIPGTPITPLLSDDQGLLRAFLKKLRGGRSKVLITSRSEEDWLGQDNRFKLGLGGLQGEERWEFCQAILRDQGKVINRQDSDLVQLMDLLDGHPLAMRVILPRLEDQAAAEVARALRSNLRDLGTVGDKAQAQLFAVLRFAEQSIPDDLRPLLVPLSLHEHFVDANCLEQMAKQADAAWTRDRINLLFETLGAAGLLRDRGQAIYEIHPALTGFLRSLRSSASPDESGDAWGRAFVDFMAQFAEDLGPRPLHEQRFSFHLHGANFYAALGEAERLRMDNRFAALTQSLAAFALNARDFKKAGDLYERLADSYRIQGIEEGEAAACHQLGMIALERRDLEAAERWYRKSLTISERLGIAHGTAKSFHVLGSIALERRDLDAAEQWYRKSLEISERLGDEYILPMTYHQLGNVALGRRDSDAAEQWYRKSLEIFERSGNEPGTAGTYHQLGKIALGRRDLDAAERWLRKSLAISERLGIEQQVASTYQGLGAIAQDRRDLDAAERCYLKSLAIEERLGYEHSAANTYYNLGMIAQERRDLDAAEQWYRKSLAISERQGDEHGAAITYGQLGILARQRGRFEESGSWFIKSILAFRRTNDAGYANLGIREFLTSTKQAPAADQAKLKVMWGAAGLGPFPEPEE
jgi:tetratricopeptide (TPR) repeat protein